MEYGMDMVCGSPMEYGMDMVCGSPMEYGMDMVCESPMEYGMDMVCGSPMEYGMRICEQLRLVDVHFSLMVPIQAPPPQKTLSTVFRHGPRDQHAIRRLTA
jgi:hypothetical protein